MLINIGTHNNKIKKYRLRYSQVTYDVSRGGKERDRMAFQNTNSKQVLDHDDGDLSGLHRNTNERTAFAVA